jgi:hypothetical protein
MPDPYPTLDLKLTAKRDPVPKNTFLDFQKLKVVILGVYILV